MFISSPDLSSNSLHLLNCLPSFIWSKNLLKFSMSQINSWFTLWNLLLSHLSQLSDILHFSNYLGQNLWNHSQICFLSYLITNASVNAVTSIFKIYTESDYFSPPSSYNHHYISHGSLEQSPGWSILLVPYRILLKQQSLLSLKNDFAYN